ncbi:MAG: hypothetical protein ACXIUM_05915 [Wenzhouxiangella sp.]
MFRFVLFTVSLSIALACGPASARADEIADALRSALSAYESGDLAAAHEDASFAAQLLAQAKAASLMEFLPEPLDGWRRSDGESQAHAAMMFGGGMTAEASYSGPGGANVEIQLLANSPMASMFANPAVMGAMGQVRRINRVSFVVTNDGQVQGMVGNVLVQVSGSAPEDLKIAHIENMDLRALANF